MQNPKRLYEYCFSQRKKNKFTYNNFCLGISLLITLIMMLPIMWCLGVVTLYVVDGGYDFNTGNCDNGIFCNSNKAYCSKDNTLYLFLGCTTIGIAATAVISIGIIILLLVAFLLFKILQRLYLYFKRKKESQNENNNLNL